jgi:hypothetical protein
LKEKEWQYGKDQAFLSLEMALIQKIRRRRRRNNDEERERNPEKPF